MPKLNGKELSDLYPKPKTYVQLKAERKEAQLARRPQFVALKIALWATLTIPIALAAYHFIVGVMNNLSSTGAVLAATSFSFLICLIGIAAIFYLYTLTNGLILKTSLSATTLYFALLIILVASGALLQLLVQSQVSVSVAALPVFLFNFLATYFAVRFLLRHGN